jgi:hypothetical protein
VQPASRARLTCSTVWPTTDAKLTLMVQLSGLMPVTRPLVLPDKLAAALDDCQATVFVRFWVDESLYIPVAISCSVRPWAT